MSHQLPLNFALLDATNFTDFFVGTNRSLLMALQNFVISANLEQDFFYLWGSSQAGKTHLLQACCNHALSHNMQAMYLSFKNVLDLNVTILDNDIDNFFAGLEVISLLCLDDIELITQNLYLEEKLFYLFNNIRSNKNKLIVAANLPANNLALKLLDLKSRLNSGITYHLKGLTEQEKIQALIMRAEQIGLQLPAKVAQFLLSRIPRNTGQLFNVLKQLDVAALGAAKSKLTIPFVSKVLNLQ